MQRQTTANAYAQMHYENGLILVKKRQHVEAFYEFNTALEQDPEYVNAYLARGNLHKTCAQFNDAIADYNKVLALDPTRLIAIHERGMVYFYQNKLDEAMADLNRYIAEVPKRALAYNNRAIIYEKQGKYDEALADMNQAIMLNSQKEKFFFNRAVVYVRLNEPEAVIKDYFQALVLEPDDKDARMNVVKRLCAERYELQVLSEETIRSISTLHLKSEFVSAIKAIENPVEKASACCGVLFDKESITHFLMFLPEKGIFKSAPENSQQVKEVRGILDNLLTTHVVTVSQLPDYAQLNFNKALVAAIKNKKAETAKRLLTIGANPDFVDAQNQNCPVLMMAIVSGLTDVCTALLLHDANPAVEFKASRAVHANLVAALSREVKAKMNAHLMSSADNGDVTISALHYAKITGNVETENNISMRMQASQPEYFVPQSVEDSSGANHLFGLFNQPVPPPKYDLVMLADVLNPDFYKKSPK